MIRRVPILIAGLAAAALLSSCSTFDSSAAARVNGDTVDDAVLETLLASPAAATGASSTTARSGFDGTQARVALGELIQARIAEQVAARYHLDLSKAQEKDLAATAKSLTGARLSKWNALSDAERRLIADFQVAPDAMKAAPGKAPADLEQRYNADPKSSGYLCIRYLALGTVEGARAALNEINKGVAFAKVADGLNAQANGGIAAGPDGSPCVALEQFRPPSIDPALASALFSAPAGKVVGPIRVDGNSGTAFFLLVNRPWSEIGTDLTKAVAQSPSYADFLATVATSHASVASRYGVWNPVSAAVDPLP